VRQACPRSGCGNRRIPEPTTRPGGPGGKSFASPAGRQQGSSVQHRRRRALWSTTTASSLPPVKRRQCTTGMMAKREGKCGDPPTPSDRTPFTRQLRSRRLVAVSVGVWTASNVSSQCPVGYQVSVHSLLFASANWRLASRLASRWYAESSVPSIAKPGQPSRCDVW
jgi:hypothetical protein